MCNISSAGHSNITWCRNPKVQHIFNNHHENLKTYTGCWKKKKFKDLTRCVVLILSREVPVNKCPKASACWDMGDFCVISTADAVVVPRLVNTSFNSSSHRRYVLFEKFFLNLQTGILCCCNTCKSLPGSEYAKIFSFPCIVCLWIRLWIDQGWDVEAQSTGLHDPPDLILWSFGYVVTQRLHCIPTWSMT
jgi:hypothetical protein